MQGERSRRTIELRSLCTVDHQAALEAAWLGFLHREAHTVSLQKTLVGLQCVGLSFALCAQEELVEEFKLFIKTRKIALQFFSL